MFLEEVEEYTIQLAERIKYNQRLAEMTGASRKDKKEYKEENEDRDLFDIDLAMEEFNNLSEDEKVLIEVITNLKRLAYEERERRGEF